VSALTAPRALESELLLRLCQTASRRAEGSERIAELAGRADFDVLASLAAEQLLLPLAARRLEESCPGLAPAGFRERAERETRHRRFRGTWHQTITASLVARLDEAGIRAVPLKGPFLAEALYGDPGLRFSGDLDLLVDPAQLDEAVDLLMANGYGATTDLVWQNGLPLLHHALPAEQPELPPIDLHWRIHWYETRFSLGMLARSEPDPLRGRRLRIDDELTALLLFYARNSLTGLRLPADLAAWWDARGHELPELPLASTIEAHPELGRAIVGAAIAAERLVGFPAERVVGDRALPGRRVELAVGLTNWDLHGSEREWETSSAAVDWLLAPAGHLRSFARRYWFQPPEAIARTYGRSPDARLANALWRQAHGTVRSLKFALRYARLRLSPPAHQA
jgi:Uncharacterised nucleotidyltransferase